MMWIMLKSLVQMQTISSTALCMCLIEFTNSSGVLIMVKLYAKRGYNNVHGLIFVNGWVSFRGVLFLESISFRIRVLRLEYSSTRIRT